MNNGRLIGKFKRETGYVFVARKSLLADNARLLQINPKEKNNLNLPVRADLSYRDIISQTGWAVIKEPYYYFRCGRKGLKLSQLL